VTEQLDPQLAHAYRLAPFGPHGPALQGLLDRMRQPGFDPVEWLVVMVEPHRRYQLHQRLPGAPPQPLAEHVYATLGECEWAVFRLRWRRLTGAFPPEESGA
jgi:hypothetical protein